MIVSKLDNSIVVWDNGGIPVEMHKKEKKYVPELCFGRLRSGSNFNDDESREGVGTNGLGSVASNIFSTEFTIETADGKNKFKQSYSKNMSKQTKPIISNSFQHFTRITYIPDFKRFGMTEIDDDSFSLIESRVYEVAGTNPNLNVYLNDKLIKIKSFRDYCMMFLDNEGDLMFDETDDHKWSIGVAPSQNGFQNISFVNSVNTFMGGSHVEFILNQFIPEIREKVNKKYKTDILPGQIKNQICLFVNATVSNPKFSSQTKERMISEPSSFINPIKLTDKFITQICKSEIVNLITDWLEQKKNADEKKAEREANKAIAKVKVEKLVDCKWSGTLKKSKCRLILTEGDSAMCAMRKFRNPSTDAGLPLRGKSLNVRDLQKTRIMENDEIMAVMSAMGLRFGENPINITSTGKIIEDKTRFGEIQIYTDADVDGTCCAALILNYIHKFWPDLIRAHKIARVETPVLIAEHKKTKKETWFYYDSEYLSLIHI